MLSYEINEVKDFRTAVPIELPVSIPNVFAFSISAEEWLAVWPDHQPGDAVVHYEDDCCYIITTETRIEPHILWHEIAHVSESHIVDDYVSNTCDNEVVADLFALTVCRGWCAHMENHLLANLYETDVEPEEIVERVMNVCDYLGLSNVSIEDIERRFEPFVEDKMSSEFMDELIGDED